MTAATGGPSGGLADQLRAAGHVVVACGWCDGAVAADRDYGGKPHAPQRKYSTKRDCQRQARNVRRRALTDHHRRNGGLIQLHRLEDAGQIPLAGVGPLPEVPQIPIGATA